MDKNKFAGALVAVAIAGSLTVLGARVTARCTADVLNQLLVAIKN